MSKVKRWSAQRKQEVVLRLLKGESLDALSRETGQTAATLSTWRDEFLEGGQANLKRRSQDPQVDALQKEKDQLQSKVGELLMDKELLEHRLALVVLVVAGDHRLDLLDGSLPEPFFLWVHYSDPHEPYAPPDLEYPRISLELNGGPLGELAADGRGQLYEIELAPGRNHLRFTEPESTDHPLFRFNTMRTDDRDVALVPATGWRTWKKRLGSNAYVGRFPATVELVNPGDEPVTVELELAGQRLMSQEEMREHYDLEVEYVGVEVVRTRKVDPGVTGVEYVDVDHIVMLREAADH